MTELLKTLTADPVANQLLILAADQQKRFDVINEAVDRSEDLGSLPEVKQFIRSAYFDGQAFSICYHEFDAANVATGERSAYEITDYGYIAEIVKRYFKAYEIFINKQIERTGGIDREQLEKEYTGPDPLADMPSLRRYMLAPNANGAILNLVIIIYEMLFTNSCGNGILIERDGEQAAASIAPLLKDACNAGQAYASILINLSMQHSNVTPAEIDEALKTFYKENKGERLNHMLDDLDREIKLNANISLINIVYELDTQQKGTANND